jgi:hypothetical protein
MTLRLLFRFYRNFLVLSLLVLGIAVYQFINQGLSVFIGLFWLKIVTSALAYYYVNTQLGVEYYYYHHFGFSKRRLWLLTLSFDLFIYFLTLYLCHRMR